MGLEAIVGLLGDDGPDRGHRMRESKHHLGKQGPRDVQDRRRVVDRHVAGPCGR